MKRGVNPVITLIEQLWREQWAQLLALLVRRLRDFDLAEDSLSDAFAVAATYWRDHGPPEKPTAWIFQVAMRKAIDRKRRQARAVKFASPIIEQDNISYLDSDPSALPDERLSLIFTCCHPALGQEAQVALTLRMVAGLATVQIARLFLVTESTMAARITRAKRKIKATGIPFAEPGPLERPERLSGVMAVIYLLFTEGYAGAVEGKMALALEAIRVAELLYALIPDSSENTALLALMLLQHARRDARFDQGGAIVTLPDQNRELWHHTEIMRGMALLGHHIGHIGYYRLQAEIAAAHCQTGSVQSDWPRIAMFYEQLDGMTASPIIRLNRAVALAEVDGPEAGLKLLEGLDAVLPHNAQLFLVRGELWARKGDTAKAMAAMHRAQAATTNSAIANHIQKRIADISGGTDQPS